MKHFYLLLTLFLQLHLSAFAQYKANVEGPQCALPECQEITTDSSITPKKTRGIQKNVHDEGIQQKVYYIEALNAVIFVPESFIPLESSFQISGALTHITKVQIYSVATNELLFQTSIPENYWNGKWKDKPQYGFFRYLINIELKDGTIETIEGIVETKNPI